MLRMRELFPRWFSRFLSLFILFNFFNLLNLLNLFGLSDLLKLLLLSDHLIKTDDQLFVLIFQFCHACAMHYAGILHLSNSFCLSLDEVRCFLGHSIVLGLELYLLLNEIHIINFLILIFLRILIPLVNLPMFQVDSVDAVKLIH